MSPDKIEADTSSCCASCGVAAGDDVKLKNCTACYLVKYCSIRCQKQHRRQHKKECRKRTAELRDELLFKQPESSHVGECPICCLPLSLDVKKSSMTACCSKLICNGCYCANERREEEASLDQRCPFCRAPLPKEGDYDKYIMKRIKANDPAAMRQEGLGKYYKGDFTGSFEYCSKAAEVGDADAHCQLSRLYNLGHGVEKDEKKEVHHLEEAAIRGHPKARYNLGCHESDNGNIERAVKHWIIAAAQGHDFSIKKLMDVFREEDGMVSKDDLAAALRAHQAAVDSAKCPQREAAEEYYENLININAED